MTISKYFVEGKVKEYYKNGFFSDILVFTSLFHIIEITKETFILETFIPQQKFSFWSIFNEYHLNY